VQVQHLVLPTHDHKTVNTYCSYSFHSIAHYKLVFKSQEENASDLPVSKLVQNKIFENLVLLVG